jgi:biopolymer transport protein ExbD
MRRTLKSPAPGIVGVNITPVIDVALVLVLILLITAPLYSVIDLGVTPPPAHTRGVEDPHRVTITVGGDGATVAVDEIVVSFADLEEAIAARIRGNGDGDPMVVIRADKRASHAVVREVLRAARAGGGVRFAIATRQHERGES